MSFLIEAGRVSNSDSDFAKISGTSEADATIPPIIPLSNWITGQNIRANGGLI